MAIVKDQKIIVKWHKCNKKKYTSKGYVFTEYDDLFPVKFEDVSVGSDIKINVTCDYCGVSYYKKRNAIKNNKKDCCENCIGIAKVGTKKQASWSKEQDKLMMGIYEDEPWDVIMERLHPFKKSTITKKAMNLGLSRKNYFTKEEIHIIKDNYHSLNLKEMCKLLPNRTSYGIQSKANKLGLVRIEKWSAEDTKLLKEIYHKYPNSYLTGVFKNRTE
ncbi:hypothetical protein ACFVRU_56140 [Streptomyces sp. NPDC057927]